MGKLRKKISFYRSVMFFRYLYFNYFSNSIVRKGKGKLIPYKNAILDIDKKAKIIIEGDKDLEVGINKLRKSKAETHVRMEKNSVWHCKNGAILFYDVLLELKENAVFDTGFFSVNGGSVIIVSKKMTFGEDVMMGRNIVIYDSDFHQILNKNGEMINKEKEIVIGDHVWLTSNITVLKGVNIGSGSLVTAQTLVRKDVSEKALLGGGASGKEVGNIIWSRELIKDYGR